MEGLIVCALLSGPPIPMDALPELTRPLAVALKEEAISQELIDEDEWKLFFFVHKIIDGRVKGVSEEFPNTKKQFHDVLLELWTRRDEFINAPRMHELERFPSREIVQEHIHFARQYSWNLEKAAEVDFAFAPYYLATQREIQNSLRYWQTLNSATSSYVYLYGRRKYLMELKEMLGDEAFYRGELPPHVPYWNFREVGK